MLKVSEDKGPPFQPGPLVQNIADRGFGEAPRQVSPSRRPAPDDVIFNGVELNADGTDHRFYEDSFFNDT